MASMRFSHSGLVPGNSCAPIGNKSPMSRPVLMQRFRYRFDNAFTSGGGFVWLMLVAMVILAVGMTGIQALISRIGLLVNPPSGGGGYFEIFWASFAKILSLGTEPTWGERIVAVLFWGITIAVTGTVIGFITSRIQGLVELLRKGRSPVVESGHVLVLGWSPRIFAVLNELAIASENQRGRLVVIFADMERDVMQEEIASRSEALSSLRVVLRRGDPTNPKDLARANVPGARSVIVLGGDSGGDAAVVSTVLAVRTVASGKPVPIVTEVDDPVTASALKSVTDGQVRPVRSQDIIAQVTAQASRQPGLGALTIDLLNFRGDEIYFAKVPQLHGKTYGDALASFPEASVIGLVSPGGVVSVNPETDWVIAEGGSVIVIAADDDRISYRAPDQAITGLATVSVLPRQSRPERILFIGWSRMGWAVFQALAPFLAPGSSVKIVARDEFVADADREAPRFEGVDVTYAPIGSSVRCLETVVGSGDFDEIIVLGYRNEISVADADAHTILTMLHVSRLLASSDHAGPRLVAEILDSRRSELARLTRVDDLVVSDSLAALMIAQLAENPELEPVFSELFDAEGARVNIEPIERYLQTGFEATFMDAVLRARTLGESAIGLREGRTGTVLLNPAKSHRFRPEVGDGLVVVGTAATGVGGVQEHPRNLPGS